jgi:kynurenine formamidase
MTFRSVFALSFAVAAVLAGSILWPFCSGQHAAGDDAEKSKNNIVTPLTLDQLASGDLKIIDLGWSLNDKNPYWPADDYEPFRLKTIATIEKNGVLSKAFFCPEHLGTHLDAPNHFEKNQPAVDQIEPSRLFAHGIVIDVTTQSGTDADYRLTKADIDAWEKANGPILEGAVVLLYTGWGRHWNNYPRYKNQDTTGKMHFPGYSAEAAKYLVEERRAKGLGIDTLSIDYGLSKDFVVHHIVNGAGRYGLENVAHLDELPPKGFYVFAAPIKIETGSGGPARIFAILKK